MTDQELVQALVERGLLDRRPCHITGMHEPEHHLRADCADMKAATIERMLLAAGVSYHELPARLHDLGDCGWCHGVPSQEKYRERLRRTWAWAGVDLTPELAASAPDKPQPDDPDTVLWLWRSGDWYSPWHGDALPIHYERVYAARDELTEQGLLEHNGAEPHRDGPRLWRLTDAGRARLREMMAALA